MILAQSATQSYFGNITTDPSLIKDADGYFHTGDLLATTGLSNNTFPYVLLADDGEDNRMDGTAGTVISNEGSPSGSYNVAVGGWQRSNAGTGNMGWTGFDYIHGGQGAKNSFTLEADTLAAGPLDFDVAILIKYTDPRGRGGRTMRFPPEPASVTDFAYRLPYAALDASKVAITSTDHEVADSPSGDSTTLSIAVRDWDATATEAADANLSDETDVSLIEPGASGAPTADVHAPFLASSPVSLTPAGTASGQPGDEIQYSGLLVNTLGAASVGDYFALVRLVDPSDATDDSAYHFGVDATTIVPSASRALAARTYQAVPVSVVAGLTPPVITGVTPVGVAGCASGSVTFAGVYDPLAGAPTSWSWNFGGGATPNTSNDEEPVVTLSATTGTYNGTLTVSNAAGSSAPFNFSYTVAGPWSLHTVDQGTTTNKGLRLWTTLYAGKPFMAAIELSPSPGTPNQARIRIAAGNVADPQAASDWTTYSLSPFPYVSIGGGTSVDVINYNGRLALTWKDTTANDLAVAIATVTEPTIPTAADWTIYNVDTASTDVGRDGKLAVHNGTLYIGYWDNVSGTTGTLKLARATVPVPASAGDWNLSTIDAAGWVGAFCGLISYDDGVSGGPRLWASYLDINTIDLKIARALTAIPASTADWQTHAVDPTGGSGRFTSMTSWNVGGSPRLAVSYGDFTTNTSELAISTVPTPASDADWRKITLASTTVSGNPWGTDVMFAGGRLLVVYNHNISSSDADLGLARANVADPVTVADFTISYPDNGVHQGYYPRIMELANGRIAIAHRQGWNTTSTVGSLRWATRNCPF
ncbi:MAG TPA: PKD domain-containing protein, partial [bacterium]|nr:PKD domain-containing protein [bacterium]